MTNQPHEAGVPEDVLTAAIHCARWPLELQELVEEVNAASDAGDLSTEQCVALGVLLDRSRRHAPETGALNNFLDFVDRWTWGNTISAEEALSCIQYHPTLRDWRNRRAALTEKNNAQ